MDQSPIIAELELLLFKSPLAALKSRAAYSDGLAKFWERLESEYDRPEFDLRFAAESAAMTKNNLNRWLKARVGFTFYDLLCRYRVYRSLIVLTDRDVTLTEAAINSGFETLEGRAESVSARYSRTVRRLLGVAPSRLFARRPDLQRQLTLSHVPDSIKARRICLPRRSLHSQDLSKGTA